MASISFETITYAAIGGFAPALLWLWFWLREDRERPEPVGLIAFTFALGMIAVILVMPIQKIAQSFITDQARLIGSWAAIEEIAKYLAVALIALRSKYIDEPIDYAMYFIVAGLGFAAMENILFLIKPLAANETTVSLLTGNLRFLGSTLLHALATGIIGISIGLSLRYMRITRFLYFIVGLSTAIALHTMFNFFIMNSTGDNLLQVFGFLWVAAVITMLLIEKLRRMSGL